MAGLNEFLFGSEDKIKKLPTGTPGMGQFHEMLLSELRNMLQPQGGYQQAQDYYKNFLNQGQNGFDQFSQPYLQQFQENVLPQIAERFAGAGALSSSGFGQALGGAASGLQSQLAQLYSQLQQQAASGFQGQLGNLGSLGLGYQPFAYTKKEGSSGYLGNLLGGLGGALGGPLGAAGASGIASLFKR